MPKRTLGWEVLGWCAEWLTDPEGNPWIFTLEQSRFILAMYSLDERGRFIHRKAVLQRLKGWG